MYVDAQLLWSDAQAITASAASSNVIDMKAIRDMGLGERLFMVVLLDVAMSDSGSNTTLAVTLETDDNSDFSSATTGQTLGTFAAVSAAGTMLIVPISIGGLNERYARLYYTIANGNLDTGSVTAFITHDVQKYTSYADNIMIS